MTSDNKSSIVTPGCVSIERSRASTDEYVPVLVSGNAREKVHVCDLSSSTETDPDAKKTQPVEYPIGCAKVGEQKGGINKY